MNQKLAAFCRSAFLAATTLIYDGPANDAAAQQQQQSDAIHKRIYEVPIVGYEYYYKSEAHPELPPMPPIPEVTFDGTGPHYLKAHYFGNPLAGSCTLNVDAVDRKTGQSTRLLELPRGSNQLDDVKDIQNNTYRRTLDGVGYVFRIKSCETFGKGFSKLVTPPLQLEITRDLSNTAPYKNTRKLPGDYQSSIEVRWDEGSKKEFLVDDSVYTLTPKVPLQIGTEIHMNREIAFVTSGGRSRSAGLNILGLQGVVENSIAQSFEEKTGRSSTDTYTIILNPDVCPKWRVQKYEVRQTGYFSAPDLDITQERKFEVPISRRLVPINTCEPGNN